MEKFLNVFRIVILTALVSASLYTGGGYKVPMLRHIWILHRRELHLKAVKL